MKYHCLNNLLILLKMILFIHPYTIKITKFEDSFKITAGKGEVIKHCSLYKKLILYRV